MMKTALRVLLMLQMLLVSLPSVASSSHHRAPPEAEREELTDAQLLEVLVQDGSAGFDPLAGVASYYASRFTGRRTTSGQHYHPDKLTAAHAVLPLGTLVTVKSLLTGLKVSVMINDRCRKRSFQLIDLSRAAAMQIGLWGKGAVKVQIIPIEKKHPLHELLDEEKES